MRRVLIPALALNTALLGVIAYELSALAPMADHADVRTGVSMVGLNRALEVATR